LMIDVSLISVYCDHSALCKPDVLTTQSNITYLLEKDAAACIILLQENTSVCIIVESCNGSNDTAQ